MNEAITVDGKNLIINGESLFVRDIAIMELMEYVTAYVFEQAKSIRELIFPDFEITFSGWVSPMSKDDPEYDSIDPKIHTYVNILSKVPTSMQEYIPTKGVSLTDEEYEEIIRRQASNLPEAKIQALIETRKDLPLDFEAYLTFSQFIDEINELES